MKRRSLDWSRYREWFSPRSMLVLFWSAGGAFFLGIFLKLTSELFEHDMTPEIDREILLYIETLRIPRINGYAVDITALGSPILISMMMILGILIKLLKKDKAGALYLLSCTAGSGLLINVLKHWIARERPNVIPRLVEVTGLSYPSGHSTLSAATFLALAFLASRHFRDLSHQILLFAVALGMIVLVCFSRLYLGVHYPSDVTSGLLIGSSWTFFITALFSYISYQKKNEV